MTDAHFEVFWGVPAALLLAASSQWAQEVKVYRTTPDLKEALHRDADLKFTDAKADPQSGSFVVDVDAKQRFQVIDGFGASLTDSSAWLLHDQLSALARREVMRKLFDREEGIGISFLRSRSALPTLPAIITVMTTCLRASATRSLRTFPYNTTGPTFCP